MALHRQGQLLAAEARTVVDHQDARKAALFDLDVDAPGARIDGVLDQLLDRARRPFDHFAGGDAVDGFGRQAADRHLPR